MTAALAFSTLGEPGIGADAIIALSRAHGATGLEVRVSDGELLSPSTPLGDARQLGERLSDADVTVLALCSYVGLCAASAGEAGGSDDEVLADLARHLDLAAAVGAGGVRVFMRDDAAGESGSAGGPTAGEQRAAARLAALAPRLDEPGVPVLIETHDSHPGARAVSSFLGGLPRTAGVGVIWDTAHSWSAGEEPAESLTLLRPWLRYLQIKDVRSRADPQPSPIGDGAFPIGALARAVADQSWTGWASLEWERAWHPHLPPLADALAATRTWAGSLLDSEGSR